MSAQAYRELVFVCFVLACCLKSSQVFSLKISTNKSDQYHVGAQEEIQIIAIYLRNAQALETFSQQPTHASQLMIHLVPNYP